MNQNNVGWKPAAEAEMTGTMTTIAPIMALMNDVNSQLSCVSAKENTVAAKELIVHLIRAEKSSTV